ncbi:hypothetical protein HanLR1_Chr04g0152201 [Helianthus annuus]|nr:hypothetical protein HanLR1_Chr04g0152201 [Helianthus annuus]
MKMKIIISIIFRVLNTTIIIVSFMNTTGIVSGIFIAVTHIPRLELLLPFSHSQPTLSPTHSVSLLFDFTGDRSQLLANTGAPASLFYRHHTPPDGLRRGYQWRRKKLKRERSGEERTGRRERTGEENGGRRQTVGCRKGSDFLLMFFGSDLGFFDLGFFIDVHGAFLIWCYFEYVEYLNMFE